MKKKNGLFNIALIIALALTTTLAATARADLPPFQVGIWRFRALGIWRTEYRARELARWYRHYDWVSIQNLWLYRRAEGVWVYGDSLTSFTCRAHCILQAPGGGVWRIWRTFTQVDIRRFRVHYRVWWPGHLNGVVADAAPPPNVLDPLNRKFALSIDHLEAVIPMEPADPVAATPINEAVMIMTPDGQTHFLGEPGFEQMPDTAGNPQGFQLATTALSEELLPPAPERLVDTFGPIPPGMAEISPGVVVQWLVDPNGNVLVDNDGVPGPDDILAPHVLGGQKHQGMLGDPTGVEGFELDLDHANRPPQLYCWELNPDGTVRGSLPGQIVIGPPADLDGDGQADPNTPIGGPIPMDPTVRDDMDQIFPGMKPVDMAVVEDDEPTPTELAQLNARLMAAGIAPIFPPFNLCIRAIRVRHWWGIDRRVVLDCWRHHWLWVIAHHFSITGGAHRVWVSRTALSAFQSSHHHFVVGQPPQWNMFTLVNVRFFRVCYRIYCPRPNVVRVAVDQIHVVVPQHPSDPNSDLVLLTTQADENALFQEVPPAVLAGLQPDPIPFDPNGLFVETIDPVLGTLDIGQGGTGGFDGDLSPLGGAPGVMQDIPIIGNQDFENALHNNQLQLYCWVLNPNGTPKQETFDVSGPTCTADITNDGVIDIQDQLAFQNCFGQPAVPPCDRADFDGNGFVDAADFAVFNCLLATNNDPACCPGGGTKTGVLSLTMPPAPAIPTFRDDAGVFMPDPTMFDMNMVATPTNCDGDADGNGAVNVNDITFIIPRLGTNPGICGDGDVDGTGAVNVNDITYVIPRLGTCNPGGPCP